MNWWRHVVAMELRKILAYRSDFWITFVGQTLIQVLIARALWQSVFEANGTDVMNGFTLPMMTLYFLIVPIGSKMLTGENMGFISREIYEGTFTRYLIYPLSFFQYKTLTYLTYSCFYGLQLILIYSVFNLFQDGMTFSMLSNLLLGVCIFLFASFAYAMMATFIELISLWADNIWSLMVMARFITVFLGGGFIPITFFPEWAVKFLAWTPFPYFVSLPVRTIMGLSSTHEVLIGIFFLILWGLIFMTAAQLIWKVGQKNYSGVGV